jgi:Flp pilus assembly protein TadG
LESQKFAVCLVVLLGALGLAIDSGFAYFAKARLSLAADSAVLAAADIYAHSADPKTQEQDAREAANAYFRANYPLGFLGTRNTTGTLTLPQPPTPNGTYLQYNAKTEHPLTFAKVLHLGNFQTITATPVVALRALKGNANIVMVLDQSSSITMGVWRTQIKPSLEKYYIDRLDNSTTRVAVIPFGDPDGTEVLVPFEEKRGFDPVQVKRALDGYVAGNTATLKALTLAVDELAKPPQDNAEKIILLFTDGVPTDAPIKKY